MKPEKKLTVRCPGCRKPSLYSVDNPWRPFCSRACHSQDLIAWATEDYKIPVTSDRDAVSGDQDDPDSSQPDDSDSSEA